MPEKTGKGHVSPGGETIDELLGRFRILHDRSASRIMERDKAGAKLRESRRLIAMTDKDPFRFIRNWKLLNQAGRLAEEARAILDAADAEQARDLP